MLPGSEVDCEKINQFVAKVGVCAHSFAGRLSLRESVALMACADLYVGVDTGPTHLFGALGKPMVAMYHPSLRSALYKPLQAPALQAIDHPAAHPQAAATIPMAEISVETVWAAVQVALQTNRSI